MRHKKLYSYRKIKKLIRCKLVYKIKCHDNGTIEQYKASLVVKDYIQTYGRDYKKPLRP
jgi:hypothetical protein